MPIKQDQKKIMRIIDGMTGERPIMMKGTMLYSETNTVKAYYDLANS